MYLIAVTTMATVATVFLSMGKVDPKSFFLSVSGFFLIIISAFLIYRGKKNGKDATFHMWVAGLVSVMLPMVAKYNYGMKYGWTLALESYNTSMLIIVSVVILYLLFNRAVFITCATLALLNWALFIYVGISKGAEYSFNLHQGNNIYHGLILTRELFLLIMTILLAYVSYRNIPIIEEYDTISEEQRKIIEEQNQQQKELALTIKDKMEGLTSLVGESNQSMTRFNDRMQSQAATFEELSSTLEELLSSAESINNTSRSLVDGNSQTEKSLARFRSLKDDTRENLDATLVTVKKVADITSKTTDSMQTVEKTISKLQEQSGVIAETVSIIVDIADQINLLSLNASIEAARAGDYGKGFAVVADEIGKLATKTGESIKEISKVLSQSTSTTEETVKIINGTATIIRTMIGEINETTQKIGSLQTSLSEEENYIETIVGQMVSNINLSKDIGIGTEEQKNAIKSSSEAMENVSGTLMEMADEMQKLAGFSEKIFGNASALLEISRKAD